MPHSVAAAGPVACALLLHKRTLAIGTHDGRVSIYVMDAGAEWRHDHTVQLSTDGVVVDGLLSLLTGLLITGCAGEVSVRTVPQLQPVAGGSIATCCTGAFCVQEKSLAALGGLGGRHRNAARVCVAMHDHLLLIDVDDGACDAQVGPTELRSKRFGKIPLGEPVIDLLWRDSLLSIAHAACYVLIDAASGSEFWRVHLRSASAPPSPSLRPTQPDGLVTMGSVQHVTAPSRMPSTASWKAVSRAVFGTGSSARPPPRTVLSEDVNQSHYMQLAGCFETRLPTPLPTGVAVCVLVEQMVHCLGLADTRGGHGDG